MVSIKAASLTALAIGMTGRSAPVPYEINTHQWLTGVAVGGSANLQSFLRDTKLNDTLYAENFDAEAADVVQSVPIQLGGRTAGHLIAKGAVLEDQGGQWVPATPPRWLFHFFDPADDSGLFVWTSNSRDWALGEGLANNYFNDYSWPQAMEYYRRSFTSALPDIRAHYQAKMFRSVGHVAHLLQDACQPSHTRDDSHSHAGLGDGFSALELWGTNHLTSGNAPPAVAAAVYTAPTMPIQPVRSLFQLAANFSHNTFVSDGTIFNYPSAANPIPSVADTTLVEEYLPGLPNPYNFHRIGLGGRSVRLCRVYTSWIFGTVETLDSPDDLVLRDHARELLPVAVSVSRAAIDYFFRGAFDIRRSDPQNPSTLIVQNLSHQNDCTFRGGQISFYYEAQDGTFHYIPTTLAVPSLAVGATMQGPGFDFGAHLAGIRAATTAPNTMPREDNRIIALYDGTIGDEPGLACLYWRAEGFVIENVETEHLVYNGAGGNISVDWSGVPQFAVRAIVTNVTCPPGWQCQSATIPFAVFADPLVFQYFCWGPSNIVGTWYSRWSVELVDRNGLRADPFEYELTCVSGGGGATSFTGNGGVPVMGLQVR